MLTTNPNWMANYLGVLSLLGYTLALYPATAYILNYKNISNRLFLRGGYWSLIITIFVGLIHGLLMTQRQNIDFYDLKTYWIYAQGILTLNLLMVFAFNFNEIKANPKRLIYFTYALLFFLACHLSPIIIHLK